MFCLIVNKNFAIRMEKTTAWFEGGGVHNATHALARDAAFVAGNL